jgi:hypothetical protein
VAELFGWLRRKAAPPPASEPAADVFTWGGLDDIAVNQAIGGLRAVLLSSLRTERGVHAETLLVGAGAVAGFAVALAGQDGVAAIWRYVAEAAADAGVAADALPDLAALLRRADETAGLPPMKGAHPRWRPREALDALWPAARQILERSDWPGAIGTRIPVRHWPAVAGVVAAQLILASEDDLNPAIGAALVMEAAVRISRIDPASGLS